MNEHPFPSGVVGPCPLCGHGQDATIHRSGDPVLFEDLLAEFPIYSVGLPFIVGRMQNGLPLYADLEEMPHLLIAGTTGSGKSVAVNALICSVLSWAGPSQVQFVLMDFKMVEFVPYRELPHLLFPVITEVDHALTAFRWLVGEMELRYRTMANEGTKHIVDHNALSFDSWPYIIVIVDELADLMLRNPDVQSPMILLAQKARAAGIHLVLSTQRPTTNIVTGLIKANVPARMAFHVTSRTDSMVILDLQGAETLRGQGDMLLSLPGLPMLHAQGAYISQPLIDHFGGLYGSDALGDSYPSTLPADVDGERGTSDPQG